MDPHTFNETDLAGAFVIELEPRRDDRGFFARVWDSSLFAQYGLNPTVAQCSISFNHARGTLRGMHYQAAPHQEAKLVRCTRGAIHDVIVDLRPHSPTFTRHFGVELTADNHRMLYIPEGMAHGFLTLEDTTEVYYHISQPYVAESARGVRWNDPAFAIYWPDTVHIISARDRSFADFVV